MAHPKPFQTPSGRGFCTPSKLVPSRSALPRSPRMSLSSGGLAELPSSPLSRQTTRTAKRRVHADKAGSESIESVRQRKQRGGRVASKPCAGPLLAIRGQSSPAPHTLSSNSTRACASPFLPTPSSSSPPCTPKFNLLDNVVSSSPSHSRFSGHGLPGDPDNEHVCPKERDSLLRKLVQAGLPTPLDNLSQTLADLLADSINQKTTTKRTLMPKPIPSVRSPSRPAAQPCPTPRPPNPVGRKDVFFTPPTCQPFSNVLGSGHPVQGRRKRMKMESAPDGSAALVLSHDTRASQRANLSRASRMQDPTSSPSPKPNTIGRRRCPIAPVSQHSSLVSAEVERMGRIAITEDELIGELGPEAAQEAMCKAMGSKKRKHPDSVLVSGKEAPHSIRTKTRLGRWLDLHGKDDDVAPVALLGMPRASEPALPTRNLMDSFSRLTMPPVGDASATAPLTEQDDAQNLFWTCTGSAPLGEAQQTALKSIGQPSVYPVQVVAGESPGNGGSAQRSQEFCESRSKLLDPALLDQQAGNKNCSGSQVVTVENSTQDGCAGSQWLQYQSHLESSQHTLQHSCEAIETISHVTQWTSDSERPSTPPLQQAYPDSMMAHSEDVFGRSPRFGYAQTTPIKPIFKPGCNLNQSLLALAPSPTILLSGKTGEEEETENRPRTREGVQRTPRNCAMRSCSRPATCSDGKLKHDYSPRSPMRQRVPSGRSVVQPLFWDPSSPGTSVGWAGMETDSWLSELDHNRDRAKVDEHTLSSFLGIGQTHSDFFLAGLEGARGSSNENWFGSMSSGGGGVGGIGCDGFLAGQGNLGALYGEQAQPSPSFLTSQQLPSQSIQPQGGVKYKNTPSFWI